MNPVGGGKLAADSPVLKELAEKVGAKSVAELSIRFVRSNPDVDTMLCGMSKPSDVDDTVAAAERGAFDAAQLATIEEFFAARSRENVKFCTQCNYCMPCPQGINIPSILSAVYEDRFLGLKDGAKRTYQWAGRVKADACVRCGACEAKCTQKLKIADEMAYAAETYGKKG